MSTRTEGLTGRKGDGEGSPDEPHGPLTSSNPRHAHPSARMMMAQRTRGREFNSDTKAGQTSSLVGHSRAEASHIVVLRSNGGTAGEQFSGSLSLLGLAQKQEAPPSRKRRQPLSARSRLPRSSLLDVSFVDNPTSSVLAATQSAHVLSTACIEELSEFIRSGKRSETFRRNLHAQSPN